jgi:hypothetical protein
MDPNNNNGNQDNGSSTVSNLPILFSNGYPNSLEKMTESQLEVFVPFLIKCSLNNRMDDDEELSVRPSWWPEELEYTYPFSKPPDFEGVSF